MAIFLILVASGVVCLAAETVVPGGVLGVLGALCLVAAVVTGYVVFDTPHAHLILVVVALSTLAGVLTWMRWFPRSRIGQRFVATETIGKISVDYKRHLNAVGIAETTLRPAGIAKIDGRRVDVITEGPFIERGTEVEVIEAEGNRLVVRAVDGA